MFDPKTRFYQCSCSGEAISVESLDDTRQVYLGLWYRGLKFPYPWKERIALCWRILTTGTLLGDDVALDAPTALELAEDIQSRISPWVEEASAKAE